MLHQYLAPPSAVPLPGQSDVRYAEGFIRWWDFHRAPLIGEDASVGDLLGLLWFDLLFLSVGVAALWRRPAILERVRFWIAGQVIVTVIAVLIVSANEWSLASVPWLLQSAMPARWLNLNNVVLPLLAVALLIHVGGEHLRRLVSPYARPLHGASVIAMIAVIFSATPLQAFDFWGPHRSLLTQVASRPGLFIIGGQTTGLELAQLRTGRVPLLQDHLLNILGYFPEFAPAVEEILNDVWGVSLLSDADAWAIDEDSSRWSARGLDDWQAIRAKYQVTDVIVPRDWTLRLPLVTESAALRLYSIP